MLDLSPLMTIVAQFIIIRSTARPTAVMETRDPTQYLITSDFATSNRVLKS